MNATATSALRSPAGWPDATGPAQKNASDDVFSALMSGSLGPLLPLPVDQNSAWRIPDLVSFAKPEPPGATPAANDVMALGDGSVLAEPAGQPAVPGTTGARATGPTPIGPTPTTLGGWAALPGFGLGLVQTAPVSTPLQTVGNALENTPQAPAVESEGAPPAGLPSLIHGKPVHGTSPAMAAQNATKQDATELDATGMEPVQSLAQDPPASISAALPLHGVAPLATNESTMPLPETNIPTAEPAPPVSQNGKSTSKPAEPLHAANRSGAAKVPPSHGAPSGKTPAASIDVAAQAPPSLQEQHRKTGDADSERQGSHPSAAPSAPPPQSGGSDAVDASGQSAMRTVLDLRLRDKPKVEEATEEPDQPAGTFRLPSGPSVEPVGPIAKHETGAAASQVKPEAEQAVSPSGYTAPTNERTQTPESAPKPPLSPAQPTAHMEPELPEKLSQTQPMRSFSLEFTPDGAKDVRLHVSQHGGDVHVALRSSDEALSGRLRDNVQDLVGNLSNAGYEADAWSSPGEGRRRQPAPEPETPHRARKGNGEDAAFEEMIQTQS